VLGTRAWSSAAGAGEADMLADLPEVVCEVLYLRKPRLTGRLDGGEPVRDH
jgi:hypothetical protein